MSRSLSTAALASILAQETAEVWLPLLTIEHEDLTTPYRFVANTEDVTSNGETFTAFPFDCRLPTAVQDQPPQAEIVIDNIDRTIVDTIRSIQSPPTITLQIVLADSPDAVEIEVADLQLTDVETDAFQIKGSLRYEDVLNAQFPEGTFTPAEFAGMFQ